MPEREPESLDALLAATFEAEPVPTLSPAFESRVRRRLALGARSRLPARYRAIFVAYWTAAAAAAVLLLDGSDLPPLAILASGPWLFTLAVTLAGLTLPLAALWRGSARPPERPLIQPRSRPGNGSAAEERLSHSSTGPSIRVGQARTRQLSALVAADPTVRLPKSRCRNSSTGPRPK